MKITSYKEALEYLDSFIKPVVFAKIRPEDAALTDPLDRMRRLLELLDNPQRKFQSVLVGGTSGKGSTSYLIAHLLATAGHKTGYTLSPHLQRVNERIQVGDKRKEISNMKFNRHPELVSGSFKREMLNQVQHDRDSYLQPISDRKFVEVLNFVIPAIEKMQKENFEPSHFEILIAMAFVYFEKEKVDIAVVEVGLGGKYDATNTVNPLVAVLTNVSLDHTAILGDTVEKIAGEKVGIIKRKALSGKGKEKELHASPFTLHTTVVTGVWQPSVIEIVEDRCREVRAEMYRLGKEFDYRIKKENEKGTVFDYYSSSPSTSLRINEATRLPARQGSSHTRSNSKSVLLFEDLFISLPGEFQVENASLAIQTALQLRKFGFKTSEEDIRKALKTAFVPGRFEVIHVQWGPVTGFLPVSARSSLTAKGGSNELRAVGNPSTRATPYNYTLDAKRYTLILDGAHNPEKMRAFIRSLKSVFGVNLHPHPNPLPKWERESGEYSNDTKFIFVISFKEGKDISEMLEEIVPIADAIIVTQFHAETYYGGGGAVEISNIKKQIEKIKGKGLPFSFTQGKRGKGKVFEAEDSRKALEKALRQAQEKTRSWTSLQAEPSVRGQDDGKQISSRNHETDSIIVVTGSLYFVGEMRDILHVSV